MAEGIPVALIGAGRRAETMYAPLCRMLGDDVNVVAVWSRSLERAAALAQKIGVPAYVDIERMVREAQPWAGIVSVSGRANGAIGLQAVDAGLHVLLETPIAPALAEADAILANAQRQGLKVEVAEQCWRWPMECIKGALIEAGFFGQVVGAGVDGLTFGYHAANLIRHYIGFDVPVVQVQGARSTNATAAHYARFSGAYGPREETWEHGILHFTDGRLGHIDWTTLGQDSALRWQGGTRFFTEKGMAIGDRLALLSADGKEPWPVHVERLAHSGEGGEMLDALIAYVDPPLIWRNPFAGQPMTDDMIGVAQCLMSLVTAIRGGGEPEYGAKQARHDQAIALAMRQSAEQGGAPLTVA